MKAVSLILTLVLSSAACAAETRPVVVELFTSQGCSSCPPADRLLAELAQRKDIVALGFHITYWDGAAWRDPFSRQASTDRQLAYDRRLTGGQIYTPQMIVNGRTEFVGNDPGALQRAITAPDDSQADPITLEVSRDNVAHISVTNAPHGSHVFLAITESNLTTSVRAGENKNRELHHAGVVRQLRDLGKTDNTFSAKVALKFDPTWNRQNIRVIAFAQQGEAGPIHGAASAPLP